MFVFPYRIYSTRGGCVCFVHYIPRTPAHSQRVNKYLWKEWKKEGQEEGKWNKIKGNGYVFLEQEKILWLLSIFSSFLGLFWRLKGGSPLLAERKKELFLSLHLFPSRGRFWSTSAGKESACNAEDLDLIPGLGRSPGGGHGNPLWYSSLENPHG